MSTTESREDDPEINRELSELVETTLASFADVSADWAFFFVVVDDEAFKSSEYYDPLRYALFVVCLISSLFAVVMTVSSVLKKLGWISASTFKKILASEAILADVPDLVVTGLIESVKGEGITTYGVLSLVTSAYNLVQDALATCRVEENSARRLRTNSPNDPTSNFEERYNKKYDSSSAREKLDNLRDWDEEQST